MSKSRGRKKTKSAPRQGRYIKLSPEMMKALEEQRERFREKFGRDPGPNDPVFFDPNADEPAPLPDITDDILAAMNKANLPPEFAYAYRKTGLLGLLADKSAWDPADVREWNAAIDEYRLLERARQRPDFPEGVWNTEIPELLLSGFSRSDLLQVIECLQAIAPIEARGVTVASRIELAANFVAAALDHAYLAGDELGDPGDGAELFARTEEIILRRAREIYSQGHH